MSFVNPSAVQVSMADIKPAVSAARGSVSSNEGGGKIKTAKSRKRVNTAEKRASHNAVERQRREALNSRFLDLARLLPSLAKSRRPSKSAIVNGSISYVTMQREQRLLAAKELRVLLAERDALLAEVNDFRARDATPLKELSGISAGVESIFKVEEEVFGTFAAGSMGGDDDEDDVEQEESVIAPSVSATTHNKASPVSIPEGIAVHSFHPDFASQSFSSDGSSFMAANTLGDSNAFFGAAMFPNLEAMTPPLSDAQSSPLSQNARYIAQSPDMNSELEGVDKVTSWAAEQLFNHVLQQQHHHQQAPVGMPFLGNSLGGQRDMPTLAGQHHAQNPYTASLLANIAATQQRAFTNGPLFNGNEESKKSYNFPAGPSQMFPSFQQQQQPPAMHDDNAWRNYALAQYQYQTQGGMANLTGGFSQQQQQQQGVKFPSIDELKDAVRAGMGLGMSMAPQSGWAGDVDSFSV